MEFKIIDGERLSIYLTCDELESCKINAELLKEPERLKELLCKAGEKTGFSVTDSALEIEIIPILDGDLLVSVKRIEKRSCDFVKITCFDNSEAVICACSLLYREYRGYSDLYFYDEKFYMVLKNVSENTEVDAILTEFGSDADFLNEAVLCEHGKLICEQNCIEKFTKNFFYR